MVRIIDSHCHPQFPQYDADRDAVIRRALDAGVQMVCVGTDVEMSRRGIELAERYDGVWASVGLHPNDELDENHDFDAYQSLAMHPKVIAIGEIGLDYYRTTEPAKKELQQLRFERQLELARTVDKPVIIHCRDAHDDMISIIENCKLKIGNYPRGVIHSFNGPLELASIYIKKGLYIGLNAIITFSGQYEEMVKSIPLDKMLLETDAPYLAPAPYRGKRNEPVYILETAKAIAKIKDLELEDLLAQTVRNSRELFDI